MRIFILVLFLMVPMTVRATQTCEPGYYKPTIESECTWCPSGYYCPDDDTDDVIVKCPSDTTDWNTIYENCGYHPLEDIKSDRIDSWAPATSDAPLIGRPPYRIENCISVNDHVELQEGQLRFDTRFNPTRNDYWRGDCLFDLFYSANPGYYLSQFNFISSKTWYFGIKPCTNEHPAHSHYSGPGTPDDPVRTGGKKDYNDCPWACDDGYGRHNDECLPLCASGATKFHVGDYVFNIYKAKLTTPAINIQLGDGSVCYVPLVQGSSKGALNVDYKGTVYHTSN